MKTPPHLASTRVLATAEESSGHQGSSAIWRHVPPQRLGNLSLVMVRADAAVTPEVV